MLQRLSFRLRAADPTVSFSPSGYIHRITPHGLKLLALSLLRDPDDESSLSSLSPSEPEPAPGASSSNVRNTLATKIKRPTEERAGLTKRIRLTADFDARPRTTGKNGYASAQISGNFSDRRGYVSQSAHHETHNTKKFAERTPRDDRFSERRDNGKEEGERRTNQRESVEKSSARGSSSRTSYSDHDRERRG